jgi:luciferase family oxidoreductase group 1
MIPLSILDLSPVPAGGSAAQSLHNSIDLAVRADTLGYRRYWLAEHHNLANIASSAPDIMIGQIAAATRNLRVGSGGVMLPNHAPLTVLERFRVLAALFPDRIDLGIGRAPGTDHVTSVALRRRQDIRDEDDFLDRFQELLLLDSDGYPKDHPFSKVHAMPNDVRLPPIFLLGSSDYSAQLAAQIGAGFSFAHHFAAHDAVDAMRLYRDKFRPSQYLTEPLAILATAAVVADTSAEAERLASTIDLSVVRRAQGVYAPLESPEVALAYDYSPIDRQRIANNRERLAVGDPNAVRAQLEALAEATRADEIMITTMIYDHEARKRSYSLLAQAFAAAPPHAMPQPLAAPAD